MGGRSQRVRQGVRLQKEKESGTGRAGLDAGFVMGDPWMSLCVAPELENGTIGIHIQEKGKKLPDSCPVMWELQRG